MQGKAAKIQKLKENVHINAERATREDCKKLRIGRQSKKAREIHKKYLKEFQQSAYRVERKLSEVWN